MDRWIIGNDCGLLLGYWLQTFKIHQSKTPKIITPYSINPLLHLVTFSRWLSESLQRQNTPMQRHDLINTSFNCGMLLHKFGKRTDRSWRRSVRHGGG
jgi:hypothetical protein